MSFNLNRLPIPRKPNRIDQLIDLIDISLALFRIPTETYPESFQAS
jgi:hypothetical protein